MKTGDKVETNSENMSYVPTAVYQGRANSRDLTRGARGRGMGRAFYHTREVGMKVMLHQMRLLNWQWLIMCVSCLD